MEHFEQRWQEVETLLEERFGKKPDMESILFLVGVNELDKLPARKFSKEQKQDLMHVAICSLLSQEGYYEFAGRDTDGWPHYNQVKAVDAQNLESQEQVLKECIIRYFNQ